MQPNYTDRDLRGIAYNLRHSIGNNSLPFAHIGRETLGKWIAAGWISKLPADRYEVTAKGWDMIAKATAE